MCTKCWIEEVMRHEANGDSLGTYTEAANEKVCEWLWIHEWLMYVSR